MSEQQIEEGVQAWLRRADKDGSGDITMNELVACLAAEGAKRPASTALAIFRKLDKNNDGVISKDEIRKNITDMYKAKLEMEIETEAKYFISTYDDGEKDKQVSKQEVIDFYEKKGSPCAKMIADALFEFHDLDKNGFISLEELCKTIQM